MLTLWTILAEWTPEAITGMVGAILTAITAAAIGIVKAINEVRRCNGKHTCVLTGRKLKPKKKSATKSTGNK